ncbi:putative LPS assembly protein LptD [Parabacteroides sp. Marseille-P3160]|uniref:putative LPS assembly protein LptD n=1 Tax=Parabacteroides sp. Marseille-P3160 TaxID=1917887 RepID=UPI0009BAC57D|nr:putative LPS assembly protein LptD [Parabacteroides sp. Marseille-P3160]
MFLMQRALLVCFVFLSGFLQVQAQEIVQMADSSALPPLEQQPDSLLRTAPDTLAADTTKKKQGLDAPVSYQSTDSIVWSVGNKAYIYGEGDVKYQQIQLQSENIEISMDSSIVYAYAGIDSVGSEFGYPLFMEGDQQMESRTMRYNFKTKKGYITDAISQQGEGYVTAGQTKKTADNVLNMLHGKYTTCDHYDHPHFYIQMSKAKIRPKKDIVAGPAYLVIEDVPLPLWVPFAFFPFTDTYSSGIIMPTFGDENTRGFFLRDGGYYFALSDYVDLAVTGEIYTKGSWGLSAKSSYRKRYKYSGGFNASYQVTKLGDKEAPDYSVQKDFRINWTHSQDAKANPYRTFSASVNFSTSGYDKNNLASMYPTASSTQASATNNIKSSSISLSQRFPNNPLNLSATMSVNQRSQDSAIAITLPDLTATVSRIYPFKRKNVIGSERWYEKVSMSYTGYLKNSIDTKENLVMKSSLIKDWKNAMQHTIPISATFSLFDYINISPTFNYVERWYSSKIDKSYDLEQQSVVEKDTTYGFYRVFNYNASISASTTLYGFFQPLGFLGNKIKMIRHRFEPSISFSIAPDFGAPKYGYYKELQYRDQYGQTVTENYSPFGEGLFGVPGRGKQGSVSFSFNNNIEAKIRSDKDSTGERKISIIDQLGLGISYNMAADSFKWSDLSAQLRLKLPMNYTINLNMVFDTYTYEYDEVRKTGRRVDVPRWQAGKGFGRLRSTGTSFSYTLNNETFKKLFGGGESDSKNKETPKPGEENEMENPDDPNALPTEEGATGKRLRGAKTETEGDMDADGYLKTTIPWSLSFNYSLNLGYNTAKFNPKTNEYPYRWVHALSFNGSIQPTKGWRLNFNATYDVEAKKISYLTCNITRDLHCFQMSASFIPVGPYKSYTFTISVSSSLLKDLKYNQSSSQLDNKLMNWY